MTDDLATPLSDTTTHDPGLRGNSIGLANLTAQVVAQLGPVASVAVLVGFVAFSAGNGSWLTWLIATGTVLMAGYAFSALTKRAASSGGLASLLAREAGPFPGIVSAVAIAFFGLGLAPFLGQLFGVYVRDYVHLLGLGGSGTDTWIVVVAALAFYLVGGFLCARDVRLSTRVMLVVEVLSLLCLALLLVVGLIRTSGPRWDSAQLSLDGVSLNGVVLGLVLAMFTFITFEAAITFSQETTGTRETVSRSMYAAVAITGAVMVFSSYVLILMFRNAGSDVTASFNPLADAADIAGMHWLSYVLQLGIVVGMLAGGIALTNWLSRLLYTLGRERVLPAGLGVTHPQHLTPHRAVLACVAVQLVVFTTVAVLGKAADLTFYSYVGTYFTLLYAFVYVVALATVAWLAWRRWDSPGVALVAVVPLGVLGLVIYNSVVPAPVSPLNLYTYASLATMVLILLVGAWGASRRQSRIARLGGSSVDLL